MSGRYEPHPETGVIDLLRELVGTPPADEIWVGDDAAVLALGDLKLLFATDIAVEGVHFDRRFGSLADVGWRALVQNLSDIAAMGGSPYAAVVAVAGAKAGEFTSIYEGLLSASRSFGCAVVGGDVSDGSSLVVSIAILGEPSGSGPVLRSGAQLGDRIYVTGELGGAAAGLRLLRADPTAIGALVDAFLRPTPRLAEGLAAGAGGASAMIDISDGLGIDLHRLADASAVGFELDVLPVVAGATEKEAVSGGEDYELVFCAPVPESVERAFAAAGLPMPMEIGSVVAEPEVRRLKGEPLDASGFEHALGSPTV